MFKPLKRQLLRPDSWLHRRAVDVFHFIWYRSDQTWQRNLFLGHPIQQCPFDLQLYQEVIYATKPRFVVQTGVADGGSILYFASLLDLVGAPADALVIGVDIELRATARAIRHPRVRLVEGDSSAPEVAAKVRALLPASRGMVVLDSLHTQAHVTAELTAFCELVETGCYLVVEDTNINGHPVARGFGPGPFEAVEAFLATHRDFVRDDTLWRRNLFSFHQYGWLRRIRR